MAYNEPRACHRCLLVKPADAFDWGDGKRGAGKSRRRRPNCRVCCREIELEREQERLDRLARAAARAASWTENGVRFRRCSACRDVKVEADGFYVGHYRKDGSAAFGSQCKRCQLARLHEYTLRLAHDPETAQQRRDDRARWQREWRARNPQQEKARALRYNRRVAADKTRAERRRDLQRIDHRIRAARDGRPVEKNVAVVDKHELPKVPARPLAEKLTELVQRTNAAYSLNDPLHRGGCGAKKEICAQVGIVERQLSAWENGEILMVEFDVVDRILCRTGWLWWDVYHAESVRTAPVTAYVRTRTPGGRWAKGMKQVRYGDPEFRPDWETLAKIEHAFTGEDVAVDARELVAA